MANDPNPVKIEVTSTADLGAVEKTTEEIKKTEEATKQQGLTEEQIAAKRAQREKEYAEWQKANREKNEREHAEFLADSQRRQEEYAKKRLELEAQTQQAVEKTAETVKKTAEAPKEVRGFGGMLDASPERKEAIEDQTKAIEDQVEALEDLTDAEAGVIDARNRKLEETNEQSKQLERLLVSQGFSQAGELFGKMADGLRDVGSQLQSVNPQLAETLETTARGTDALASILGAAGAGAAVGGPIGAGIGAIAAAVAELGRAWLETEVVIAEAEEKIRDQARQTEAAIRERNAELAGEEMAKWIESLDDEEKAIAKVNSALERNIELARAKRRADLEIQDSKAALDLAKIDADPNMSEADKIRARAGIQEGIERRRAQTQLDDLRAKDEAAQRAAREANEEARRADEDIRSLEAERDRQEIIVRDNNGKGDPEAKRKAEERINEINASLPDKRKDRDALASAAGDARDDAALVGGVTREQARAIIEAYENNRERRDITAGASADKSRAREEEKAKREEERRRKQEEREAERQAAERERAGTTGEGFADQAARAVDKKLPRAADALEKLGNAIAANPTAQGLDQLGNALDRLVEFIGKTDPTVARQLRTLADKVERLEQKLRRGGNG